jgi:signal peptidase II
MNAEQYRVKVVNWMSVITVFSIAYLLDGWFLGYLKPLLDFPRPPLALLPGTVNVVGTPEYHHSLPSGHSSFAMLVTASLWPVLNRGWRIAGAIFVLWVGTSRISLGAHFPADVMAGFLSSLAVVLIVHVAIRKLMSLYIDMKTS